MSGLVHVLCGWDAHALMKRANLDHLGGWYQRSVAPAVPACRASECHVPRPEWLATITLAVLDGLSDGGAALAPGVNAHMLGKYSCMLAARLPDGCSVLRRLSQAHPP